MKINAKDHFGLVGSITKKFVQGRRERLEDTEEFGDGLFGLCNAIRTFDTAHGVKFSTYAYWCIYNAICKGVRTRKTHSYGEKVQFGQMRDKDFSRLNLVDYRENPDAQGQKHAEAKQLVEEVLALVPEETESQRLDKQIFIDYFLHGKTLKEIGSLIVSPFTGKPLGQERVRQRRDRVMRLIQDLMSAKEMKVAI